MSTAYKHDGHTKDNDRESGTEDKLVSSSLEPAHGAMGRDPSSAMVSVIT